MRETATKASWVQCSTGMMTPLINGDARGNDRKTGFVLLVFPFGDQEEGAPHRCNYIVVILMREQIKRFEGQPDMTGHA